MVPLKYIYWFPSTSIGAGKYPAESVTMAWLAWKEDEFSETFGMDTTDDEPLEYYVAGKTTWEDELELAQYDELVDLMENDEISAEEEGWLRGAERIELY